MGICQKSGCLLARKATFTARPWHIKATVWLTKAPSKIIIGFVSAAITNTLGQSREEIVQVLRARGGVNADELATSLGLSKQCVRKHLDVLERDGYVQHIA